MRVLVLSPYPETILFALAQAGDEGVVYNGPPELLPEADYLVSFGYRHILREPQLAEFPMRALNIHMAYLPFNRGANPNFWSWHDDTKKGASIHYITPKIDSGPIAARVEATFFSPATTLHSSWLYLYHTASNLFDAAWPYIRDGGFECVDVDDRDGSFHKKSDLPAPFRDGKHWDTPVKDIMAMGRKARENGPQTNQAY